MKPMKVFSACIETEVQIKATPEKVWKILTNFDAYPLWNPFIKAISGDVQLGKRFTVSIKPPQAQGMTFKPKVVVFESNKELTWFGQLLISGLFDGTHQFLILPNKDGTSTFRQSEQFKGILVPLFSKLINVNSKSGFEAMNLKLKALAEIDQ